jgi:two-component system CheB/CheR fusion protein
MVGETEVSAGNDVPEGSQGIAAPKIAIIGIGGSAGSISALQQLFDTLPAPLGAALVIILHLDPNHTSELDNIIAAHTRLRVVQVNGPLNLEADTVYVIPPDRRLQITGDAIGTAPFNEPRGRRAPIDLFFRSLAEWHGEVCAVILSGGGSDGSVGVSAIKEKGGVILVQDPAEAEVPSMPRSAIAAGADFVLPVREIAAKLVDLIQHKSTKHQEIDDDEVSIGRILNHLRVKTGQDFSKYKPATIKRRVARRMQLARAETLGQYLAYLREHGEEVQALFNDLLISVTNFFRDPDAFEFLARDIIPALFQDDRPDNDVRVWIPACATGEEAYSLAILLLEESARREIRPNIHLFATDLDEHALSVAREGRYASAITADLSESRLRRFFIREGDQYRIRQEVRDLVVFASHNILKDPPFSRMNLISCRNILIYLDRDMQLHVCKILHYALKPRGFLFLGTSESADNPPGLFDVVNRDARVYQAIEQPRDNVVSLPRFSGALRLHEPTGALRTPRSPVPIDSAVHRQALEDIAPPSMLVDESHAVVNLSESAGRFLLLPAGPVASDAAHLVRSELRLELQAALYRAFERNERTVSFPIAVQFDGTRQTVVLAVHPIMLDNAPRCALVMFIEGGPADPNPPKDSEASGETPHVINQMREELYATRLLLKTSREQHEATTEALHAANEELQSVHEEYRSTSEELETSKEELQSINEELQTLNAELKIKLDTLSRAHNDLQNLMNATDISTIFLDSALRIQRFTPRTADLFNLAAGDEGRPITDLTHKLVYQDFAVDARRLLADLVPIERTVRTIDGRWFMMRLRPYRTIDDRIDGVVITFVDVTEQREAEAAWTARQQLLLKEMAHRMKNTLTVVQAITRKSLRGSGVAPDALRTLEARIDAMAASHGLLVKNEWHGADLEELSRQQLAIYLAQGDERITLSGPRITLPANIATPFGLVLHELGTNAAKYGALKETPGRVDLTWRLRSPQDGSQVLEMVWREHDGPAVVAPTHQGAGNALIERGIPGATVDRDFRPDGLVCTVTLPWTDGG